MSRGFVIGVGVVLVLGCVLLVAVIQGVLQGIAKQIVTTPAEVNTVAHNIAEFDLPPGYTPDYAVDLLGFTLAAYTPGEDHCHLMLLQAPRGVHVDQQELERQRDSGRQDGVNVRMTTVSTEARTIRGQDATLVISEGTSSDGTVYRQASLVFEGKQGTALLTFMEPQSRWDMDTVETFIDSIH